MNIEYWSTVLTKLSPLKVDSKLCARVITPKSTCSHCITACPFDSISFDHNEIIIGQCYYCGLCVSKCPNDVFRLEDRHLYSASGSNNTLVVTCNQYIHTLSKFKEKDTLLKINCLNQLYPELMLALLAKHQRIVLFLDEHLCQDCLHFSLTQLKEKLSSYQGLWPELDALPIEVITDEQEILKLMAPAPDAKESCNEGRRSFFRQTLFGAKTLPQRVMVNAIEKLETKEEKDILDKDFTIPEGHSVKKYYLKRALSQKPPQDLSLSLPYPALRAKNCNLCGVCSMLCPTKALQMKTSDEEKQLLFSPHLCSNCDVCTSICFFESLYWGEESIAKDFVNKTAYLIARGPKNMEVPKSTGMIQSGF